MKKSKHLIKECAQAPPGKIVSWMVFHKDGRSKTVNAMTAYDASAACNWSMSECSSWQQIELDLNPKLNGHGT